MGAFFIVKIVCIANTFLPGKVFKASRHVTLRVFKVQNCAKKEKNLICKRCVFDFSFSWRPNFRFSNAPRKNVDSAV